MTMRPPRITAGRGISRNSTMPIRLANTGSSSLELEINAALFTLRALEIGLSAADLEKLSVGMVLDMITEKSYDEHGYIRAATQADMDRF